MTKPLIEIEDMDTTKKENKGIPSEMLSTGTPISEQPVQQAPKQAPTQGEVIDLPSCGVHGYPSQVTLSPMLVRHEEIIARATEKTIYRTYNQVVVDLIGNPDWADKMTINDRDYILMYIWLRTYNNNIKTTEQCVHCGKEHTYDLTISNDSIVYPDDRLRQGPIEFPFELLGRLPVSLATIGMDNKIEAYAEANGIDLLTDVTAHSRLKLAYMVDFKDPLLALDEKFLMNVVRDKITTVDKRRIQKMEEHFNYGFPLTITHKCKSDSCGKQFDARFPFNLSEIFSSESGDTDEDFLLSL